MGWLWGSSDKNNVDKSSDPLKDLDPSLRDFLAKESPLKYGSTNYPRHPATTSEPSPLSTADASYTAPPTESKSANVPTAHKDGRYADLWKTYKSQADVDAETKTDQEKLDDIIGAFNYRKEEIGRVALENCALEQMKIQDCFENGSLTDRAMLCRPQNKSFQRCYMMQAKFLKALGYMSTFESTPEEDERIQMHADKLYTRMLEQEKVIEAAKKSGQPIPTFPSILSAQSILATSSTTKATPFPQKPEARRSDGAIALENSLKAKLDKIEDVEEREVEKRAIEGDMRVNEELAKHVGTIRDRQAAERQRRKEEGKLSMGDVLYGLFNR